jgi:hypothetical protein
MDIEKLKAATAIIAFIVGSAATPANADQAEFDRAYQQCLAVFREANENLLAALQRDDFPPEAVQNVRRRVAENLRIMGPNCTHNARLVERCHGNEDCIWDGLDKTAK